MNNPAAPKTIYLKEYRQPNYWLDEVALRFELEDQATRVHSELKLHRNNDVTDNLSLWLDGEALELKSLAIDGRRLTENEYQISENGLLIHAVPERFLLQVETHIYPQKNSSLEGLYRSSGNFCTQCEAQGFRKITYYPDRPDVMATFTTTLVADKKAYPVLLSNGNKTDSGELDNGKHWATWHDPFPKPSYLFALVAGDLAQINDTHTTADGREIALSIFVEHHNRDKCAHAMTSLQKAMLWDEETFGLVYDLDVYMIVAVDDFNMGAMENKGLNVFNSKYVLANSDTATDQDFQGIEAVIGHEYFHNWTGNRITCRDWFQLSLKEGLTVFRDQEFSSDMGSRAVKRIEDVRMLRARQFPEDSGPMAHPIRPEAYMEINNFYTLTVYEKGAEVIRMQHTLLGEAGFRNGMDLYFERFDGQAVTCEDFVTAMADANGRDMSQFMRWYSQAGTPQLQVTEAFDAKKKQYRLTFKQQAPTTPGQPADEKLPLQIPLRMGLLSSSGEALPLRLQGETEADGIERVLEITEA
ncbi:MAG: aminopeptidase N, partial [Gammaproteobacteria bacterium]|nr:aminopeptidase N [Gammaproteobacteria bacterium]